MLLAKAIDFVTRIDTIPRLLYLVTKYNLLVCQKIWLFILGRKNVKLKPGECLICVSGTINETMGYQWII